MKQLCSISELCGLLLLQAWAHQEALLGTDESRHRARRLYQRCIEVNPDSVHAWQVTLSAVPSISFTVLHCFVCEWLNMVPLCIDGRCEYFSEDNYNIYEQTFEWRYDVMWCGSIRHGVYWSKKHVISQGHVSSLRGGSVQILTVFLAFRYFWISDRFYLCLNLPTLSLPSYVSQCTQLSCEIISRCIRSSYSWLNCCGRDVGVCTHGAGKRKS